MTKKILYIIGIIISFTLIPSAYAQSAKVVATFNDWQVHVFGEKKICFITSQPVKKVLSEKGTRGQIVFYITNWPKDKVHNEISVKIGYPFKDGHKPVVKIDDQSFNFVSKQDKAFVEKTEQEGQLIEAMKKGKNMIVTGESSKGKISTDTYSLTGLSKALEELNKLCPKS